MGNKATKGEEAYRIKLDKEHKIGEGSFANVYRIRMRASNQKCAAKIFKCGIESINSKD